jgi:hypothetical protein
MWLRNTSWTFCDFSVAIGSLFFVLFFGARSCWDRLESGPMDAADPAIARAMPASAHPPVGRRELA